MTGAPMTLAERIRKIAGFAALAAASEDLAQKAQTDALETAHWQAFDGAVSSLLGLTSSPEGQEALEQLERMARFAADLDVKMTNPVFVGIDLASTPDVTVTGWVNGPPQPKLDGGGA